MPKVKTKRVKFPKGWDVVEDTLNALQDKMREGKKNIENRKRKNENNNQTNNRTNQIRIK